MLARCCQATITSVDSFPMKFRSFPALLLYVLTLCASGPHAAFGQSGINFKVIPALQPIKEIGPTPDFTVVNAEGKKVALKDFRGKTLFLNFWATWCVPCREEM